MEVRIDTYVENNEGMRHPINRAFFVMVAMGANNRPTKVPTLIIENVSRPSGTVPLNEKKTESR